MNNLFKNIDGKAIVVMALNNNNLVFLQMFPHEDEYEIAQVVYDLMKRANEEAYMMTKERFVRLFDFTTLKT